MLRKFKISVDGKEYLVEMEELTASSQPVAQATAVQPPSQPLPDIKAEPAAVPQEPVQAAASGMEPEHVMASPMPGTILKLFVAIGDTVKVNQPLMILEAMKMENEIVAPQDGKIIDIFVNLGQTVDAGTKLIGIG